MKNRLVAASLLAAFGATTLSGCSALAVGEEEFACTGMPGSVYCHSARDVYEKTNDGVVPSPVGKATGSYNEDCEDCVRAEDVNPELAVEEDENTRLAAGVSKAKSTETINVVDLKTGEHKAVQRKSLEVHDDEIINNYVAPRLPSEPVPVRTPAQIMRIWVAPFVDTNGDLAAPGFVYTEIEPRRWIYPGDETWGNHRMFAPLQASDTYSHASRTNSSSKGFNSLERFKRDVQSNAGN